MKAVMLMFDSLNRHFLPPYGCEWVHAPNFTRLAERSAMFTSAYVGSMPCMPTRRELHTARPNLLHRSWGPLEPFDDSMPAILQRAGVHTHLASDHYHYWEDGGATYHTRYSTWQAVRGQEGDPWMGQVADPRVPDAIGKRTDTRMWRQDWINRRFMQREEDTTLHRTIHAGKDFLRRNAGQDNWLLHVECFDPHEPFFAPQRFRDLYPHDYAGPHFDWPPYRAVEETPEQVAHCRFEYAALLSYCDEKLGEVMDLFDELRLWDDTMLIVNCDHGHMLGEHGCWAKCWQPWYDELARMPLFIWDPRSRAAGVRRASLVQTIDLPVTLMGYLGVPPTGDMLGADLAATVAGDRPAREAGIFGNYGGAVNVTDGRYVYLRAPADGGEGPLYEYTLMPTHMRGMFGVEELQDIRLAEPFGFTKGCRLMKIPGARRKNLQQYATLLFDTRTDPGQDRPLDDPALERRMIDLLVGEMRRCEAPPEQYDRLGLPRPG